MKFTKAGRAGWVASALVLAATAAQATSVTPGSGWVPFYFDDAVAPVGSQAVAGQWLDAPAADDAAMPASFELNLSTAAWVRVVDAGLAGDRFELFANGQSLGLTSAVAAGSADAGFDFDAAAQDASHRWSHGAWKLDAGHYTLTGLATQTPFGPGLGAIQVTAVPEPSTWAALFAGLGVVMVLSRRRFN